MRIVFADTLYWYGFANPRDQWNSPVLQARVQLGKVRLLTTKEVLVEFFAAMSGGGAFLRQTAVELTRTIMADETVQVLPQSHSSFLRGMELYANRPDKSYSLVDCISMNAMRDEGISDILTNDHHFSQEGFNILIRKP